MGTPNLPTNMVDFGGFHSSIMLCLRGGILMSIGNSPESLSQAMLVGAMFVGRLGVCERYRNNAEHLNQYCRMNHPDCK